MMKSCKQLLLSAVCAAAVFGTTAVRAAETADADEFSSKIASGESVVLFKVHDINPIKNEDGIITDCEFGLTFYNRSPKSIDAATMNLSWTDEGIANVIDFEEQQDISMTSQSVRSLSQAAQPKTADVTSKDLTTSVVLPQIKPFRQLSLKSKLKTDRCFLMLENADFSFTVCNVTDTSVNTNTRRLTSSKGQTGSDCASLFRFVSSKDPEYYREFQKVSFNEEAARRQEERKKNMEEIDESYNKILEGINNITETLNSINGEK